MKKNDFLHPQQTSALNEAQAPFWFWNDKLEDEELLRQLELMSENGIQASAPHARTGFLGDYMDDEWLHHIKLVLDYKREHGEKMWIYDEFNWPSGMAGGEVTKHEEFREKYLLFERCDVPAGTTFHAQVYNLMAGASKFEDALDGVVHNQAPNIFCYDAETKEKLNLQDFMIPKIYHGMSVEDFELNRDRDTIVYVARILTEFFDGEGKLDPDYLNKEATQHFIQVTHEAYYREFPEDFGSVLTVAFNDETRFCHAFPWTTTLPLEFRKRYGYDLLDHLPDLLIPGDEAGRTRLHYFELVANLYRENYHNTIHTWCKDHGIDYCPHLLGEETLAGQVRFSGDFMRQMAAVGRPGVDHLGKGIGSLDIKFASSAADCYGKEGLACENFAGCGWDLSYEEYLRMTTWLYAQGVKTLVNHGFFYSIRDFRKNDWPPSQFFQWNHWDKMKDANALTRRYYGMLTGGYREVDTLIYHPVETYWLHYLADQRFTHAYYRGPLVADERAAEIDKKEQYLLSGLQMKNLDYTVFPSDAVSNFRCENGHLINTLTGQSYTTFILPMCEVLPLAVVNLLRQFVDEDGKLLILDCLPKYAMTREDDALVKESMEKFLAEGKISFMEDAADVDAISAWIRSNTPEMLTITSGLSENESTYRDYPSWVIDPYIHDGEDISGIYHCRYVQDSERRFFLVNYTTEPQTLTAKVHASQIPEIWDPLTGQITPVQVLEQNGTEYHVAFTLQPHYGTFLVTEI